MLFLMSSSCSNLSFSFSQTNSATNSQVTMAKTMINPSNWKQLVSCLQQIMLRPTVKIFLVVMTKGGKCCLNCLIIRQTNICPTALSTPIPTICTTNNLCSNMNLAMLHVYVNMQEQRKATMATHLLMAVIISIGCGLQTDLISAWKSGKNPSANKDATSRIIPINSVFFSSLWADSGLKTLNMTIPAVTIMPTIIFFIPNFNFLSFTLEHITPTKMTERMLQDLNIMTTGKLLRQMAYVQVRVEMATVIAQRNEFLVGIYTLS